MTSFCTHLYSVRGSMKLPLVIEESDKMVNAIEKDAHGMESINIGAQVAPRLARSLAIITAVLGS